MHLSELAFSKLGFQSVDLICNILFLQGWGKWHASSSCNIQTPSQSYSFFTERTVTSGSLPEVMIPSKAQYWALLLVCGICVLSYHQTEVNFQLLPVLKNREGRQHVFEWDVSHIWPSWEQNCLLDCQRFTRPLVPFKYKFQDIYNDARVRTISLVSCKLLFS